MSNIDLTPIIQAIVTLLAALITSRLIPWIKKRTSLAQQELMAATVRTLVFAAEQLFGAGHGEEKLEYVTERLEEKGFTVDFDMIEAAVREHFWYYKGIEVEPVEADAADGIFDPEADAPEAD